MDQQEELVRAMASETRFGRRMLVDAFDGVVRRPVVPGEQFTRRAQSLSVPNRYYAFTVMGRRPSVDYQVYRENRAQVLTAYCRGVRLKHPDAREVIGIAIDPVTTDVTSQDVVYLDFLGPPTTEELAAARKDCDELGIMKDSAMTETEYLAQEFPEPKSIMGFGQVKVGPGNRAERRAQASAQRRKGGGKRGR